MTNRASPPEGDTTESLRAVWKSHFRHDYDPNRGIDEYECRGCAWIGTTPAAAVHAGGCPIAALASALARLEAAVDALQHCGYDETDCIDCGGPPHNEWCRFWKLRDIVPGLFASTNDLKSAEVANPDGEGGVQKGD